MTTLTFLLDIAVMIAIIATQPAGQTVYMQDTGASLKVLQIQARVGFTVN